MARKPDIQYIRFYTDGSAARQLEPVWPKRKKAAAPKQPVQKTRIIHVDPLALGGILVSVVMLVMMIAGSVQLHTARQQQQQMRDYVTRLQENHAELQATYDTGYDAEAYEKAALAMGMIPVESTTRITVSVSEPEIVEQPTLWERIVIFFTGLFA